MNYKPQHLLLIFSAIFICLPAQAQAADPDQVYTLSRSILACEFQDDMEIAERYVTRRDADMLMFLLKKGRCWIDESGYNVRIAQVSKFHPLCVKVVPDGDLKAFWVLATGIIGYVDNVLIPEMQNKKIPNLPR